MPTSNYRMHPYCDTASAQAVHWLDRYDEQAANLTSVTSQFASTQQALQELQAEFGDQAHEQVKLKTQLESAQSEHSHLQAARDAEIGSLAQQLAELHQSVEQLQVGNWHTTIAYCTRNSIVVVLVVLMLICSCCIALLIITDIIHSFPVVA